MAKWQGLCQVYLRQLDKPICSHKCWAVSWVWERGKMWLWPSVCSMWPWWKFVQLSLCCKHWCSIILFFSCITSWHLLPLMQHISGMMYAPHAPSNLATDFLLYKLGEAQNVELGALGLGWTPRTSSWHRQWKQDQKWLKGIKEGSKERYGFPSSELHQLDVGQAAQSVECKGWTKGTQDMF